MKDSVSYPQFSLQQSLAHFPFPCIFPAKLPTSSCHNISQHIATTFYIPFAPLLALKLRLHCCLCCDVCEMPLEQDRSTSAFLNVSDVYSLMPLLATCIGINRSQLVSAFPGYIVRSSCAIWKSRNDVLVPRSCVEMRCSWCSTCQLGTCDGSVVPHFLRYVSTALSRCVPHPDLSSLVVHFERFLTGILCPKDVPNATSTYIYGTRTDQVCGISGVRGWSLMICRLQ